MPDDAAWRCQSIVDTMGTILEKETGFQSTTQPVVEESCIPQADAADPTWRELLRPLWQKLKRSFTDQQTRVKTWIRTLVAVVVLGMIPWPHQVTCKVVCEPAIRRYISAPFDATLLQSYVNVGQQVSEGDVLAFLDGGELRAELAAKRAIRAQASQRHMAALASGDHSKAENERLEVEYLQREIEILESRKNRFRSSLAYQRRGHLGRSGACRGGAVRRG